MDYTKKYFVDLFTGSFVVGANVVDKYDKILANDIIGDLIGIHKSLLNSDDIIEKVKSLCPDKTDKDGFLKLRESYNKDKSPEKLFALILCCTNNLMRFNKSFLFNQTFGERTFNMNTQNKIDEFCKYIRPYKDKIIFTSRHFQDVNISKPSMVYIDPPYSNTEAGYNSYWNKDDDMKLYNYCKDLDRNGSSFMVSGSIKHDGKSCLLLDKLINDNYKYKELIFDYNKVSRKGKKETQEIIITNYNNYDE
jgi:DNA adenine methylase Dam